MHRAASAHSGAVDVFDVHFALYGALPAFVGPLRRVPLVVHFQGPWASESRVGGASAVAAAAKRAIERALYRRAEALIVLSPAFGELLVRDYGVDAGRIHVIPPGVDLDVFRPSEPRSAREALGAYPATFVVVCARRLEYRMGIDVLLEAWRAIQEQVPECLLLIAGGGSRRDELAALANSLPRPDGIRLLGPVDDGTLVRLYQGATCSVVPSRALEGFGLVVLESLACGTPPIVTDAGGLSEGVRSLDPSLVVPNEDAAALATRLLAAANGQLPGRAACRAHAESFDWREVANRHCRVLESIVASKRARSNGRQRVAFVDHCALLSGGELALARLLPALDVEAHVILGEDGPLRTRLEQAGATVHILPLRDDVGRFRRHEVGIGALPQVLRTSNYVLRLARLLRRLEPDLVHTNSLKAALYGGLAGRIAGIPVVWHLRDRIADDYLPRSAVRLVRGAARLVPSAIIANSAATLATLGDITVPAVVVPSPVDVPLRSSLVRDRPLRVGIVGRLASWKGQDLFLQAFARAFPDGDVEAVVIGSALFGDDDFEQELKELVVSLGLEGRVDFRGFRDDVAIELERLEVVVHASVIPEPFGQVVVEAMAVGLAVVVPDQGGPAEVIEGEVTGLTYPMGDEAALAAALRRIAADPELRATLGSAARVASQRYRPEVVAAEVLACYAAVGRTRSDRPSRRQPRAAAAVSRSGK